MPPRYVCVGCGKPRAKRKQSYCRKCRWRVNHGICTDVEDVPTREECREASRRVDQFLLACALPCRS